MSLINRKTSINEYKVLVSNITLPSDYPAEQAEIFVKALGEFEHLCKINDFRNEKGCAQSVDLLVALLSQGPVHSRQILLGYGYSNWGSRVSVNNRAQRTDAIGKVGLGTKQRLTNKCEEIGITGEDSLRAALTKLRQYNDQTEDFEPYKSKLGLAIDTFLSIY